MLFVNVEENSQIADAAAILRHRRARQLDRAVTAWLLLSLPDRGADAASIGIRRAMKDLRA